MKTTAKIQKREKKHIYLRETYTYGTSKNVLFK